MKCNNPHTFEYTKGIILNSGKSDITSHDSFERISNIKPCWDSCRLNHYHVKSRDEYYNNKMKNGYANCDTKRQDNFQIFDANEIYDVSMLKWAEPVKNFDLIADIH